jgi:hypothetical protein
MEYSVDKCELKTLSRHGILSILLISLFLCRFEIYCKNNDYFIAIKSGDARM